MDSVVYLCHDEYLSLRLAVQYESCDYVNEHTQHHYANYTIAYGTSCLLFFVAGSGGIETNKA
jgi:hypothetical protein